MQISGSSGIDHSHLTSLDLWSPTTAPHTAHLAGICGAGMKALAEFLHDRGWQLCGSDQNPEVPTVEQFRKRGILVHQRHAAENVPTTAAVLIHSPAINAANCELQAALDRGIPVLSYIDALANLTHLSDTFAIAGTHGKSTTTSMLGAILVSAGRSPSMICGAESRAWEINGRAGASSHLIVEACEFRRHFLNLHPSNACLLGIEPDHFDCYPDLNSAIDAYSAFCRRIPSHGTIVHRADCEATRAAIQPAIAQQVSFGLDCAGADWEGVEIHVEWGNTCFSLRHEAHVSGPIRLQVPGRHNVFNAVAAAACAGVMGLTLAEIITGLESYGGLKRRMEPRGVWQGAEVYDDYAHHPTEIRAAISTLREMFPEKRLICVFQPHQVSRTSALLDEFAAALSLADRTYLLPIFAAREMPGHEAVAVAQKLLGKISSSAEWIAALDQVWGTVQTDAGNDAVILTLGAGNLTRVHYDSPDRLR